MKSQSPCNSKHDFLLPPLLTSLTSSLAMFAHFHHTLDILSSLSFLNVSDTFQMLDLFSSSHNFRIIFLQLSALLILGSFNSFLKSYFPNQAKLDHSKLDSAPSHSIHLILFFYCFFQWHLSSIKTFYYVFIIHLYIYNCLLPLECKLNKDRNIYFHQCFPSSWNIA